MGRRRAVHGALLAVALAAGVILGLLGMHAFDAHGTAHSGSVGAHAMTTDGADAGTATGHADAAVGRADAVAAAASAHGSAADSGCASCGAGGLAAACVLALLAGALLLLLPRSWTTPWALRVLLDGTPPLGGVLSLRAPSLHVLCISRR